MSGMNIRIVPHGSGLYWKAVELRSKHLREPLGLAFTPEELEAEASSFHVVATKNDEVVGSVTLATYSKHVLKLRQMIVAPVLHKQNLGRKIIETAEQLALDNGFDQIELHARETAVNFYQKCGYKVLGEQFTEVTIPHRSMKMCLVKNCKTTDMDRLALQKS